MSIKYCAKAVLVLGAIIFAAPAGAASSDSPHGYRPQKPPVEVHLETIDNYQPGPRQPMAAPPPAPAFSNMPPEVDAAVIDAPEITLQPRSKPSVDIDRYIMLHRAGKNLPVHKPVLRTPENIAPIPEAVPALPPPTALTPSSQSGAVAPSHLKPSPSAPAAEVAKTATPAATQEKLAEKAMAAAPEPIARQVPSPGPAPMLAPEKPSAPPPAKVTILSDRIKMKEPPLTKTSLANIWIDDKAQEPAPVTQTLSATPAPAPASALTPQEEITWQQPSAPPAPASELPSEAIPSAPVAAATSTAAPVSVPTPATPAPAPAASMPAATTTNTAPAAPPAPAPAPAVASAPASPEKAPVEPVERTVTMQGPLPPAPIPLPDPATIIEEAAKEEAAKLAEAQAMASKPAAPPPAPAPATAAVESQPVPLAAAPEKSASKETTVETKAESSPTPAPTPKTSKKDTMPDAGKDSAAAIMGVAPAKMASARENVFTTDTPLDEALREIEKTDPPVTALEAAPEKIASAAVTAAQAVVPSHDEMSIAFDAKSSTLSSPAEQYLDNIAQQLNDMPDARIQLRAYAATHGGSESDARRMSLSRALMVRSYLADKGIKPGRLDVRALGSKTDQTPSDRVDIMFLR